MNLERYTKKILTLITMGDLLAPLSTCKRLQTSTIIFPCDCSAIYSMGYNGPARGLPNDNCIDEQGHCGCTHAEANAIAKFNNDIAKPSLMYTAYMPCQYCAALLLNCNKIIGILYKHNYRNDDGHLLLKQAEMPIIHTVDINTTNSHDLLIYWKSLC